MTENLEVQAISNEDFHLESTSHVLNSAPGKEFKEIGGALHNEKQCEDSMRESVCACNEY